MIGSTLWALGDGWIPPASTGPEPDMTSHESARMLNTNTDDAHVELTLYFADRPPAGPYRQTIPAQRVRHIRFNDLIDPEPVPVGTDYSVVIHSDLPIVVQHTRLDSRQAANALMSTIAFPSSRHAHSDGRGTRDEEQNAHHRGSDAEVVGVPTARQLPRSTKIPPATSLRWTENQRWPRHRLRCHPNPGRRHHQRNTQRC
jgi:hypothetical protein